MKPLVCFSETDYQVLYNAKRTEQGLELNFEVVGRAIRWVPESNKPIARDGLYRSTCFEAFVARDEKAYLEVNASPSRDWRYHWFSGYREQAPAKKLSPPVVQITGEQQLHLMIPLSELEDLPAPWQIGVSAVIEHAAGKDYWALTHCKSEPDFHVRDSFTLKI